MPEQRPSIEECKAQVLKDGRYNRIDPDDFPDETWVTLYDRIMAERAERRAVMADIRAGKPLTQACTGAGADSLHLTDIIEALPNREDPVADVMADLGFTENCPLGYLGDLDRAAVLEKLDNAFGNR